MGLGYSNGGQLLIRTLLEAPDLLDGAVLVGATMPATDNLVPLDSHGLRSVPIVLVHGTADRIVPFAGGMASLFGFRPRGRMRSFDDSLDFWRDRAGGTQPPTTVALPHRSPTTTSVTEIAHRQPGHPPILGYRVERGGHVVPNRRRAGNRIMGRTAPDIDVETLLDRLSESLSEADLGKA